MTQKRVPGKGWDFIVYNVLDQVAMTQDANQRNRAPKEWSYTKYDAMGRVIITGIWMDANSSADANLNTPSTSRLVSLQQTFDTTTFPKWESPDSSTPTGYTNESVPKSVPAAWNTINYYDNYSNIPGLPVPYTNTTYSNRTTGLLTATKTNVLGTSDMLWTVNYYDEEGRVARTFTQHYLGGHDKLSDYNYDDVRTIYNFNDQPLSVAHYHFRSNAAKTAAIAGLTVSNTYEYDHMGRKIWVYNKLKHESLNSQERVAISKLTYNGVGQMTKKQLHGIDPYSSFLQNVDYRYNERGWLSSINNNTLASDGGYTNSDSKDKFGIELSYEQAGSARPQYNGNIARATWKQGPVNDVTPSKKIYDYDYDRINRLTSAVSTTVSSQDGFFNEALTYDNMGNIKTLGRYDRGGSNNGKTQIDTLSYTYSGNKLTRVDDGITGTAGFNNGASQADEYTYDGNGNMLKDLNKGITAITHIICLTCRRL